MLSTLHTEALGAQAGPQAVASDGISSVTGSKECSPRKVEVEKVIKVQNQPYILQH